MREGKHAWLTGWGTLIGGLASVGLLIVSYLTYAHPRTGEQKFSVTLNRQDEAPRAQGTQPSKERSIEFEVKKCSIGSKLVSCSLTVVSPHYDRSLLIMRYSTRLIDSDGDPFEMTSDTVNLSLERDQKLTFKLAFAVNKDVVRPLTVKMIGSIDNERLDKGFEIR